MLVKSAAVAPTHGETKKSAVHSRVIKDQRPGLTVERFFTRQGVDPFETVEWERRDAVISGADGKIFFEQRGVEFPRTWSQTATNVVVQKYFRGTLGTAGNGDKSGMAWALMAGVGYEVNKNLTLEVGYRYLNLGDAHSGRIRNAFLNESYAPLKVKDIDSHDFRIGMRWNLRNMTSRTSMMTFWPIKDTR